LNWYRKVNTFVAEVVNIMCDLDWFHIQTNLNSAKGVYWLQQKNALRRQLSRVDNLSNSKLESISIL